MNDFDFEELDKAVQQLAAKTPADHDSPDAAVQPPSAPVAPSAMPIEVKPAPKPTAKPEIASSVPKFTPPKHAMRLSDAPKPRGSFMDIVPPAPRKPLSRMGISVQPVDKVKDILPEPPKPAPQPPEDYPSPDLEPVTETPSAQPEQHAHEIAWPDPLELHDVDGDKTSARPKETAKEETAEPASSPFIAQAKVEKRPLGAFSHFQPTQEPKAPKPQPQADDVPSAITDELTSEKDGTFKEPETPKEPAVDHPDSPETKPAEPTKPDLHNTAMMSIPKQYQTEAKSADKTKRPVFDTHEYHPPLLEAANDHRGGGGMWSKLFIALVVLVLLSVAGYFAYLFLTQR